MPYRVVIRHLGVSRSSLDRLCDRNVFTVVSPHGRGPGKPLYLLTAEVEVYGRTRSEDAVREYRRKLSDELHPADVGGEGGA